MAGGIVFIYARSKAAAIARTGRGEKGLIVGN
jgi:hypothetical protein